ncbi:MAG: hypothetical protein KJ601_02195 [Nanoarchaeota archaeon]|nr:hypothetical protein [Nanoarchaeota archaeon]MBU1704583.1 hypothetical protein [Nanoarchaeota archaeon]
MSATKEQAVQIFKSYGFDDSGPIDRDIRIILRQKVEQGNLGSLVGALAAATDKHLAELYLKGQMPTQSDRDNLAYSAFANISLLARSFALSDRHRYQAEDQIPQAVESVDQLVRGIARKPDVIPWSFNVSEADSRDLLSTARNFLSRDLKYLLQVFVTSLALTPEYVNTLLGRHIKEEHEQGREISQTTDFICRSERYRFNKNALDYKLKALLDEHARPHTSDERSELMHRIRDLLPKYDDLNFIANYSRTNLISVGHMYVGDLRQGRLSGLSHREPNEAALRRINRTETENSAAVLTALYKQCFSILSDIYGTPDTSSAIVVGGSNGRKEFPFFDIDAALVYGKKDKTSEGVKTAFFFDRLEVLLEAAATIAGHQYDPLVSRNRFRAGTIDDYADYLGSEESVPLLSMFSFMTYGAGSKTLAGKLMSTIRGLQGEHKDRLATEQYTSRKLGVYGESTPNVKYSRGGLNAIWRTVAMHKFVEQDNINDTLELIRRLPHLKDSDRAALAESYHFLMNIRIALDLSFGRNNKMLPKGYELDKFAKRNLLYESVDGFMADYARYTQTVYDITEPLYQHMVPKKGRVEARSNDLVSDAIRGVAPSVSQIRWLEKNDPATLRKLGYL